MLSLPPLQPIEFHPLAIIFVVARYCLLTMLVASSSSAKAAAVGLSTNNNDVVPVAAINQQKHVPPPPAKLPPLVLLDRDGVVNEDVGAPGVLEPSQLRLTPGAGKAIGELRRAGSRVVLVTNQSCVGKGLIARSDLESIHETLRRMLLAEDGDAVLDRVYACTSVRGSGDPRMKPGPGMVLEACRGFGVSARDCALIGDTTGDLRAAGAGGVALRVLVATGYGSGIMEGLEKRDDMRMPRFIDQKGGEEEGGVGEEEEDHSSGRNPQQQLSLPRSILPFVFADNLSGAVSWLLGEMVVTD